MSQNKEEQQQDEFKKILLDLSKSMEVLKEPKDRREMYKRLESLYSKDSLGHRFRHYYSDIFFILTEVDNNPELGHINHLSDNLQILKNGYQPKNYNDKNELVDISDSIKKLYDHVNLDVARIEFSKKLLSSNSGEELERKLSALDNKTKELQSSQNKIDQHLFNMSEKISNSEKEYISILGIFAAVVLAFTGGIAFSTSVLNNIDKVNAYRIIIVALIIGLVLVNVLFGLFYYINKLVNNSEKIKPLIVSNIVILLLIAATSFAWYNGYIEERDQRINDRQTNVSDTVTEMITDENIEIANES